MAGSLLVPSVCLSAGVSGRAITQASVGGMRPPMTMLQTAPDGKTHYRTNLLTKKSGKKAKKSPARVTANGAHIYGWNCDLQYATGSLYELTADGIESLWSDATEMAPPVNGCYLFNGKIAGPALVTDGMSIYGGYWREYDFATGQNTLTEEWNLWEDPIYECMVFNPSDGYVYAFGQWNPYNEFAAPLLMRFSPFNPKQPDVLAEATENSQRLYGMCYNGNDETIYAVNGTGQLVKLLTDGTVVPVTTVDFDGTDIEWQRTWRSGMAYNEIDKQIYFVPRSIDGSYLTTLDPITGKVSRYADSPVQLPSLFNTDEAYADPATPLRAQLTASVFDNGALSGHNVYRLPAADASGQTMNGTVTLTAWVDDVQVSSVSGAAGSEVTVNYTNLDEGNRRFRTQVEYNGKFSRSAWDRLYIGYDTPKAPTDVTLTAGSVSWTPVTTGVNGGYVPADNLTYDVYLNDELLGSANGSSFDVVLDANKPLNMYTATVVARYTHPVSGAELRSASGVSNSVGMGQPYTVPFTVKPTPIQASLTVIQDYNEDGMTWRYDEERECYSIEYSEEDNYNDDWLILMPFTVTETDRFYSLDFEVNRWDSDYDCEYLEVSLGTEPNADAMSQVLVESFTPEAVSGDFGTVSTIFRVDEPGTYYLGFRMMSDPDQLGISLRNIRVSDHNITDQSPAAVDDLTATEGENGALTATVNFTMPTTSINGEALPEDAELTATVSCQNQVTVTGTPGQECQTTVTTQQGNNQVSVTVAMGELNGQTVSTTVYTGVHMPAAPENVRVEVTENLRSATISWDPVTTGADGGYVDPAGVTYNIYAMSNVHGWGYYEDIDATSFTYDSPDRPVDNIFLGVVSKNMVGVNYTIVGRYIFVGTPYTLPLDETFSNAEQGSDLTPYTTANVGESMEAEFGMDYLSTLGSGFEIPDQMVLFMRGPVGSAGVLGTPFFSTEGLSEAKVTLNLNCGLDFPTLYVMGSTDCGQTLTDIAVITADPAPQFSDCTFRLPASLLGKPAVNLYLGAELTQENQKVILTRMSIQGTQSSVDDVTFASGIFGGKGCITVNGHDGEQLEVYDMSGRTVMQRSITGNHVSYTLPAGAYVVKAGTARVKAIVQ